MGMVPVHGFEPRTYCLRNNCSTPELHRRSLTVHSTSERSVCWSVPTKARRVARVTASQAAIRFAGLRSRTRITTSTPARTVPRGRAVLICIEIASGAMSTNSPESIL